MRKAEKIAICRILHDLIKADAIIDAGEMKCYALMKEKYGISQDEEYSATQITFANALKELMRTEEDIRRGFYYDCANMTVSDGFCARSEALLMIALKGILCEDNEDMDVLSIQKQSFNIPTASVLYIESNESKNIDRLIQSNYRMLFKESQIASSLDLLIACTDMTQGADIIGRPIFATSEYGQYTFSMDLALLTPKGNCKMYLFHTLHTSFYHSYIKPFASGTTVKHLNMIGVENYPIMVPLNRVLVKFEELLTPIYRIIHKNINVIRDLTKQRNELLPLLMNGQVSVNCDLSQTLHHRYIICASYNIIMNDEQDYCKSHYGWNGECSDCGAVGTIDTAD